MVPRSGGRVLRAGAERSGRVWGSGASSYSSRLEAMATRLEAIPTRLEAIATRVEACGGACFSGGARRLRYPGGFFQPMPEHLDLVEKRGWRRSRLKRTRGRKPGSLETFCFGRYTVHLNNRKAEVFSGRLTDLEC